MFCPKCNEELVKGADQRFETLSEHVCDPNGTYRPLRPVFICGNPECPASSQALFWDESGDMYGFNNGFEFSHDISSAYPSISRRLDIEVYKKGLKKRINLHPIFTLWTLKPLIEFNYKADDYGNVTNRTYSLKWLKKDYWLKRDKFGYHIYYSFPIPKIIRSIRHTKILLDNCSESFIENQLKSIFDPIQSWDKRWWRHFNLWLSKIIFRKHYLRFREIS